MKKFTLLAVVFLLFFITIFFACKKKIANDTGQTNSTENSYNLQDFVVQDVADAVILDREDAHHIKQHSVAEVGKGAVDTIYLQVMVNLDKIKLKPRFYDISKVVSVDPDTNKVRDLNKYDGQDLPSIKVGFNNDMVRTFVIVAGKIINQDIVDLVSNQREHFVATYQLKEDGTALTANQYREIVYKKHTPLLGDKTIKDTIEIQLTYSTDKPIHFNPTKWGVSDTAKNIQKSVDPLVITPVLKENKTYALVSYTFSNGFKREYAVRIIKPTSIFTDFKVLGHKVAYAKADCTIIADNQVANTLIVDEKIIIVPPIINSLGRKVNFQFTDLAAGTTAEVVGFNGEKPTATGLNADGKIEIDFTNAIKDSIKLVLAIGGDANNKKEYVIKLLSGMLGKPQLIMDGTNTIENYKTTSTRKDVEFKMTMSKNKVYILAINYTGTTIGSIATFDLQNSNYDVYAYDIVTGKAGVATKLSTDGKKIIDIVSINDKLYGIAQTATTAKATNASGNSSYQIYRWNSEEKDATPTAISAVIEPGVYNFCFTGRKESNDICFYAPAGNLPTSNPKVVQYKLAETGSSETTKIIPAINQNWNSNMVGTGLYGSTYTHYSDVSDVFGIITGINGTTLGNDFNGKGDIVAKSFNKVAAIAAEGGGGRLHVGGGNIEKIRDKYYLPVGFYVNNTNKTYFQSWHIIDFGKTPKEMITKIENEDRGKDATKALTTFFGQNAYKEILTNFSFSAAANPGGRGNFCTYKLDDGKVRIGLLVPEYGFKVLEIQ